MSNYCYIHIPFCSSKCNYCRFASFGNLDDLKINFYVNYLLKEIQNKELHNKLHGKSNKKIDFKKLKSIYFGGGTPSILKIDQLEKIINTLKRKFDFDKNIEINIEATPITITEEKLIGWKKLGINRLSIGVQTLNNKSLEEIGRGNKGDILKALNCIKSVGFKNVSLDFIIGLPYVKKGEIINDINYILNNFDFIKHISVYMLEEYYYPGNWKNISIKENDFLNEYLDIKNILEKKGFNRYEISNYGLDGYECIHNKAYWNHKNIIAFGLGAHGFINGQRYSNSEQFKDYYSGKLLVDKKNSTQDYFIEKLMFGLRTTGLDKDISNKLNTEKINYFILNGYLEYKGDKICLTDDGIIVLDYILGEII